jgi:tetratricopeptide (TPR) repeat protein
MVCMSAPTSDKLEKLQQMLAREPRDPFLLYGIAMEYKKLRAFDRAVEFFNRTIEVDPAYCYAYFHRGQTLELAGNASAARESYREGIAAADRAGDAHATEELQAALDMLG